MGLLSRIKTAAGPAPQPTPTLPPIYAAPGRRAALEHCISLASEELATIDKFHDNQSGDVSKMRRDITDLKHDLEVELNRTVEAPCPQYWSEHHERKMGEFEGMLDYNLTSLKPHVSGFDGQKEYRQSGRYREQLIRLPDRIFKELFQ